ncbi:tRNA (adenosine(37)-N6)-threonylcarbamoyltransferase complex dimerization subunit type 1 TsaB [Thermosulfuriphilus sp.]
MPRYLILSIETSEPFGGVALLDEEEILGEFTLSGPETHSRRLLWATEILLRRQGLKIQELKAVAVSLGPGSFTGLRIGLATAKGLAYTLGCSIVGIPTLDALAAHLPWVTGAVCPVLDAKKAQIYTALYVNGGRLTDYLAISPEDWREKLQGLKEDIYFLGPGLKIYGEFFRNNLKGKAFFAPAHLNHVRPTTVGILAARRLKKGQSDDLKRLSPIYVRPSEAEINLGRILIQTTTLPAEA